MLSKFKLNQLYFKDTQFANLMTRRIFNVLLIANPYDAFMLEDDGRIDEKIFNEYTSLSLRYPPRFTQVSTCEEALTQLSSISFDLIICMPGTGDNDSFDVARYIKNLYEQIPMVILTPFSHGITKRIANEDLSPFEYVFCWLGNTDLLVSIIKLVEDKMNLEHDVNEVGVQLILLVEDGIRFYSSILPNLYKFVLKQSQEFSTEALNAHQRTLRMRGRPKIVLARTYEEAFGIYQKYKNNILGVITDVRFPRVERGEKDGLAGRHPQGRPVCTPYHTVQRIGQRSVCSQIRCRLHRQEFQKDGCGPAPYCIRQFRLRRLYLPQPGHAGRDCPRKESQRAAEHSFCCSGRIIPLPHQPLALLTCHVSRGRVPAAHHLE